MLTSSEKEQRIVKLKKLEELKIDPYPASVKKEVNNQSFLNNFDAFKEKDVSLAGRIRSIRSHGNLSFVNLEDESANVQIVFSKKDLKDDAYKNFIKLIDTGDFIEVSGNAFLTHKQEKSLLVKDYNLLTKALRPLPDNWYGLKNEEERYRKRYLDIIANREVKEMIYKRAKFWQATRNFLVDKGFLEVETPILETNPGGADAQAFSTHHNALDIPVYLRISMGELWQKKLMVAGFDKTFEIGRQFRNEGMDADHLQDYSQMEFYWAYADYQMGMDLVKELYIHIAQETFGTTKFKIKDFELDLNSDWQVYDYQKTILKYTNLDVLNTSEEEIRAKLEELKIDYDKKGFNITRAIDNLWKYCRKNISGPGFLINPPITISPLAKRKADNSQLAQRFQVILAGSEMGNGYSELNNPIDQEERFKEQQSLREAGDVEAQRHDKDFVEALEYGMPPTCGFGFSERLFSYLMNKTARECQIFPLMRPKD